MVLDNATGAAMFLLSFQAELQRRAEVQDVSTVTAEHRLAVSHA